LFDNDKCRFRLRRDGAFDDQDYLYPYREIKSNTRPNSITLAFMDHANPGPGSGPHTQEGNVTLGWAKQKHHIINLSIDEENTNSLSLNTVIYIFKPEGVEKDSRGPIVKFQGALEMQCPE
jgi:hypothetical protein